MRIGQACEILLSRHWEIPLPMQLTNNKLSFLLTFNEHIHEVLISHLDAF